MLDISNIDENFEIKTYIDKDDIKFYSVEEKPFKVYGVFKESGRYRRLPERIAQNISEGVYNLHTNTAGGRVKFKTNSCYVAIYAKLNGVGKMPHFAFSGSIGFDLYAENDYIKTFIPPLDINDGYESLIEFDNNDFREITINFPLYSNVDELYVGVQKMAVIEEASPYKNKKPIVFYGSSITQGGCASRPGMCYPNIISRRFNYDYINLGFSGSAMAEDGIIEYIKKLDMSLFVYDYDHNSPTIEHLKTTHKKMFDAIRKEKPCLPIILMSRPKLHLTSEEEKRKNIIEKTYNNAVSKGDKNIFFIDGRRLMKECGAEGTVDNCHPTDLGFFSISKVLGDVIKNINYI